MNNKAYWQFLKFLNQWHICPTGLFLGWTIGDTLKLPKDALLSTKELSLIILLISFLLFSLSMIYQTICGYSVDCKLYKIIDSINRKNAKLLNIHNSLDELRDRLIFEDDNQYWETLLRLVEE